MRCLYCDKRLSLLKLAKGDSFCSPEHFDAHQLKLSKDAFQRLMKAPEEDSPKEPLVFTPREEVEEVQEAVDAPAPLASFVTPVLPGVAENAPAPIVNTADGSEPVEGGREVAFPVHDVAATIGILNLYLRLGLAGSEPSSWTSERHLIVTAEYFHLEIQQPLLELRPELPANESPEPVQETLPVEIEAAEEAPVEIQQPLLELRPEVPVTETAEPVQETLPVEIEGAEEAPVAITPVASAEARLPFLMAPSFQEKKGTSIFLDGEARQVPTGSTPAPVLKRSNLTRLESCDTIPKSTLFAENRAFHLEDSTSHRIGGAAEIPIAPGSVLPLAKEQARKDAWSPSKRGMVIQWSALRGRRTPSRAAGSVLPEWAGLLVRLDSPALDAMDPQWMVGNRVSKAEGSFFLGVLETRPLGREPSFINPLPCSVALGWRAILAPVSEWEGLRAGWQRGISYLSLRDSIRAGWAGPIAPVQAVLYAPSCRIIEHVGEIGLPKEYPVEVQYRPNGWAAADSASIPFPSAPGVAFNGSAMLPKAQSVPAGSLKTGSGAPGPRWEPRLAAFEIPAMVKLLPVRNGTILPSAKSWPQLVAIPE